MKKEAGIEALLGKTIKSIDKKSLYNGNTKLVFKCSDGTVYEMYHDQDCCELVTLEEIIGDLKDLLDSPILLAEKVTNEGKPLVDFDTCLWTFYKLSTNRGSVTLRWYGESNGYYSEEVSFFKISKGVE